MRKVYLAIPYTWNPIKSFEIANLVAGELMRAGDVVFSPISQSHPIAMASDMPGDWEFWKKQDIPMIDWCDVMVVVHIGGEAHRTSVGVQAEIKYAQSKGKGISFRYMPYVPKKQKFKFPIGINGKMGVGKDETRLIITDYFKEKYQIHLKHGKLARKLKLALELFYPDEFSAEAWEYGSKEYREGVMPSLGMTRREALQCVGTKLRQVHPSFHVKANMQGKNGIYDDIRFDNEGEEVWEQGGKLIQVTSTIRGEQSDDESENSFTLTPDLLLENNFTDTESYRGYIYKKLDEWIENQ